MSAWHVRASGKTVGPVTSSQLKQGVEQGKIPANAQVRKDGTEEWVPITKVKGLPWPEVSVEPTGLAPVRSELASLPQPLYHAPAAVAPMMPQPMQVAAPTVVNVHVAAPAMRRWSRGTAILLSLIVPGLGQAYKGQIINGLVWFVLTIIGYIAFIIPGMLLHLLCLIGASRGNETK
jgi:TM2 domain-containing membrane protein YozV